MEIWIKKDTKNVIRLPINPPEFEVTREANNTEVTRYGKGPAVLMGKAGLKKISFSSFFPKQVYAFNQYQQSYQLKDGTKVNLNAPMEYVRLLNSWMDEPVTLIITGTHVNCAVIIESFAYNNPDAVEDVAYTISFKEYAKPTYTKPKGKTKANGTGKANKKEGSKGNKTDRSTKKAKTTKYAVKKGDTLQKISKKITGTSSNWKKIYTQNKKTIEAAAKKKGKKSSEQGYWIYPGTKLVVKA